MVRTYATDPSSDTVPLLRALGGVGSGTISDNLSKVKQMNLNDYAAEVHDANAKWWHDIETGERIERNKGEMLCLIHSEVSECLEGVRKDLMDDHLPHRKMEEVELADALIRILDYAAGHGLDIQGAYDDKMAYNAKRVDHKAENRQMKGGKKF